VAEVNYFKIKKMNKTQFCILRVIVRESIKMNKTP